MLKIIWNRLLARFARNSKSGYLNYPDLKNKVGSLQKLLGFRLGAIHYYVKALTHRSYLEINPDLKKSNERLEFLGDSVLNMIVAEFLFDNYTQEGEGFLTKARSSLVNRDRLYKTAEKLNLKHYILYNSRYLGDSSEGLQTILADAVEALIGAIYLDKGLKTAKFFVREWIIDPYEQDESYLIDTNYKGQLLEYTHAKKLEVPRYVVKEIKGPEHRREFTVEVMIGNEVVGSGTGRSKKGAEQEASKEALSKLKVDPNSQIKN